MIYSGFNLELKNNDGMSALQLMCIHNRVEILRILLTYLLNNDLKKSYRDSILNQLNDKFQLCGMSFAIKTKHKECVQLLILAGSKCYFSMNDV